jgi:hypothetical protein
LMPTWGYKNHTDRWFMNDDSHHVIIDESVLPFLRNATCD